MVTEAPFLCITYNFFFCFMVCSCTEFLQKFYCFCIFQLYFKSFNLFSWYSPTEVLPFPCPTLILFRHVPLPATPLCSCRHTPPDLPFTTLQQITTRPTDLPEKLYYLKKIIQLHIHLFTTSHLPHKDKFTPGHKTTMNILCYPFMYCN